MLEAAARVFARDGLDGATTRAIAREAGVNEVTLFRQFGTKEHLIEAVVGRAFGGDSAPAQCPAPDTGCLRADLDDFARRYEARLMENLPLIRAVLGEIHRHEECEHKALHGIFRPLRAALVARLQAARDRGEIVAGLDPAVAADLFAGMIFSGILRGIKPLAPREYEPTDYRSACVDVFVRGAQAQAPAPEGSGLP